MQSTWTRVDRYFREKLLGSDPIQDATLKTSTESTLPPINVSALQGRFLQMLAAMIHARNILEIGTLGGYSTIWLARALPKDGKLISLEYLERNADVARANLLRAGFKDQVEIRVGPALQTLPELETEGKGPFDFIFIDADKENNSRYFTWAMKFARPGTIIIVDNVARYGGVADSSSEAAGDKDLRELFTLVQAEPRAQATAIQTVGSKGHDGFLMIRVL